MKRNVLIIIIALFLLWNALMFILFLSKTSTKTSLESSAVEGGVDGLNEIVDELRERSLRLDLVNSRLIQEARDLIEALKKLPGKSGGEAPASTVHPRVIIPVLVMACDRITVKMILEKLLKLRPSDDFPVVVSQDCGHQLTADTIRAFGDKITFIRQPDLSDFDLPAKQRHNKGYYKISRHYRWALGQVFDVLNYTSVIIVEDDLDVSSDFFEYFRAAYSVMAADPTIWCVSAWNDNGKEEFVDVARPDLLYRTDFFPGLGWMLFKDTWNELRPKWPVTYWDDWMRHPDQRRGRSCIRPEISRTSTFGKIGVSKGQYFEKHLKYIKHHTGHVPFTQLDLSYLVKDSYDESFLREVYASPLYNYNDLFDTLPSDVKTYRVEYKALSEFPVIAKTLGIMEDLKSDVPRTGYLGVVSTMYKGRRVFISPPPPEQVLQSLRSS